MDQPNATGSPAASDAVNARRTNARLSGREVAALAIALVVGIAIRLALLPTQGLRGDIDQFVLWVHGIAVDGLANAYDQGLSFPPVMAYVWAWLAALAPAFQTVTDGADPAIRVIMKLPATLADLGLALVVAAILRDRPRAAVIAAGAILLHPAVIDVSAWWGQYESFYVLYGAAAVLCAVRGLDGMAAAFVALAILAKPQALPFIIPFAAWFWARGGLRGLLTAGAIGLAVGVLLWLPFVPANGPANYLETLLYYQDEVYNVLSVRAWNAWWLVQEALAGGRFLDDNVAILGPLTLRHLGYGVVALGSAAIGLAIVRDPRPQTLILGLAASSLISFAFLTGMHERYAYPVLVFLMLRISDPGLRWAGLAFGVVLTLNLLAAVPPTPDIGALLPVAGPLGIGGSVAIVALAGALLWRLLRDAQDHRATAVRTAAGL